MSQQDEPEDNEFAQLLDSVGWSMGGFAGRVGINRRTAERAYAGTNPMNAKLVDYLRKVDKAIKKVPLPEGFGPKE